MKVIATIKRVGTMSEAREYVSQRGNHGYAFPVKIGTELGEAVFEAYVDSEDRLAQRGIVTGAIGTIDISCKFRNYTDRDGNLRFSNDLVLDSFSWQLANQNMQQKKDEPERPAQMVRTPEQQAAVDAKVAEAQSAPGNTEKLPF